MGLAFKHPLLAGLLVLCGCGNAELAADERSMRMGVDAVVALGCGACHDVPGVAWPKSNVGPPLLAWGTRGLIAGVIPNTAENLAAFIQNATAVVPTGAMPPIAMTDRQAADIAAYLLSLKEED